MKANDRIEFLDRWIFQPNLKQIAPTGIRRFFVNDRLQVCYNLFFAVP